MVGGKKNHELSDVKKFFNHEVFLTKFQLFKQLTISYPIFSDAADKLQQIWEKCYVSDYTKEFFMAELGPIFLYI